METHSTPKFTFDDVEFSLREPIPPRVKKAIDTLDQLPGDKLISTARLAQLVGTTDMHSMTAHPALKEYREIKKGATLAWGNKETIRQYREWKNGRNDA